MGVRANLLLVWRVLEDLLHVPAHVQRLQHLVALVQDEVLWAGADEGRKRGPHFKAGYMGSSHSLPWRRLVYLRAQKQGTGSFAEYALIPLVSSSFSRTS